MRGREFVHVFTSKGIYETYEDLWFKCVAFDDSTLLVSNRSHTAYVEIVDPSDSVVWSEKYRMSGGMCDGHVYVGDDWKTGEYRMFVHTRGSLGREDSVVYPKRLLIVGELPEVPDFLSAAKERMQYIDIADTTLADRLNVTVTLDSAEYQARSKARATVRVTDSDGNPVRAVMAMSVADALYSYPPADVDIESLAYGLLHDSVRTNARGFEPVLSDGVASGRLEPRNKKSTSPLEGQYINVLDEKAERGAVNIIATGKGGYFEVSPEIGSSLGETLLLRLLGDEYYKPRLNVDDPFKSIADIRNSAKESYLPVIRRDKFEDEINDTIDYSGRHTIQLDEVVVKGKDKNFSRRKKDKLMGYLDSLALTRRSAWLCCGEIINGEYVGGYLNDYIEGYTHHPLDDPLFSLRRPVNVSVPERGKPYRMIKIKWLNSMQTLFEVEELWTVFDAPNYSDDELLSMGDLSKSQGYYHKHRFKPHDENDWLPGIEDSRNTLMWLPRAQTDENGEFTLEFLTSDIGSTYRISGFVLTSDARNAKSINEYFTVK